MRGELQFAILKVVSPEALLEAKDYVDVVGTIKRGEIEGQSFAISSGHGEVVGFVT